MSDESPLLKQYRAVKADHPDAILMFRIGDFFEMFEQDAITASRELELTLTSKALGKAGRLPLAGVPQSSVESYIARLVRKGYHVAVCDQTEDAKKAKGLVKREVIRVITPGTYLGSDGRQNKFIASYCAKANAFSACDLLTGELYVARVNDQPMLEALLARFRPAEIVLPDSLEQKFDAGESFITRLPDWKFAESYSVDLLKRHFKISRLEGLGFDAANFDGGAAAALLSYLGETQKSALGHVLSLHRIDMDDVVPLDASTLLQLEIVDSPSRDRETTLLSLLDQAITAMGSRLIARRLTAPLKDPGQIRERHNLVEAFATDSLMRETARTIFKSISDLERLAGRISLRTVTPREVVGLASSLEAVPSLKNALENSIFEAIKKRLDPLLDLSEVIRQRLVESPPAEIGAAPLFREGAYPQLDELRNGSRSSRQWIAELQASERVRTGIGSLKVGFNNIFGYYIDVTNSHLSKVPEDYRRKQTISTGERFFTEDLKRHEEIVLRANERITDMERDLFKELCESLQPFLARIKMTAEAVAELDLSAAFAEVAEMRRFVRPEIIENETAILRIEAGRHPMVEALLSGEDSFVPNNVTLEKDATFMILTGPNMAGKSTYIRQVALIALMAQVGSFVPARKCVMTPFHGIHARIGSSDRLARGLSTFMVEMIEAAMILRNATARSLVILDEIGRGTSTYDGLSIAWSIVEALAARGSLTLFATHYHELTQLADTIPGVMNATVSVKEWNDRIHFLHEIRAGAADRSYGIHVAALAGVPADVLRRAKEVLTGLEVGELRNQPIADQLSLFGGTAPSVLDARMKEIDPDSISPRDAHALLVELKGMIS